tara:strand:+ start:97 stop:414 length:318 start_codon:yes stop_codon:yes gene_type:complete
MSWEDILKETGNYSLGQIKTAKKILNGGDVENDVSFFRGFLEERARIALQDDEPITRENAVKGERMLVLSKQLEEIEKELKDVFSEARELLDDINTSEFYRRAMR